METAALALVVYSGQVLGVVGVAALAAMVLPLPLPAARLAYWRAVGALCLCLPCLPLLSAAPSNGSSAAVALVIADRIAAESPGIQLPWGAIVIWTWIGGALARGGWLLLGAGRLRLVRRCSLPAVLGDDIDALRTTVAPEAEFRWSRAVTEPVTCGVRRPHILLPPSFAHMGAAVQQAVACHELLHVARRDCAWIVAEELARACLWFHPGVWWVLEQVQLSREQLVDQLVVKRTASRRAYMSALVMFADSRSIPSPSLAFLRARHLKSRLRQLSKECHMSRMRLLSKATALLLVLGSATVTVVRALPLEVPAPRLVADPGAVHVSAEQSGRREEPVDGQDPGVTLPVPVAEVKPEYTPAALQAQIQGTVLLEIVVLANGAVGDVTVTGSLDTTYGLDDQAVTAAKQWQFRPGRKDGKPVPVRVHLEMRFMLK